MIDLSKRVYVYFNLHKKVWSIRQGGKVVEHTKEIHLKDCKYLVGQAGRQKVLKEKRKNVHAGISGYVTTPPMRGSYDPWMVTYNPYKNKTFVYRHNEKPIETSELCHLICGEGWRQCVAYNEITK